MVSIYIAGTQVDLFEDFNYSFNYSSVDIRFPEKRNADFSKTIKLAGTKANNQLFEHIYEVGIDGGFDANKKQSALVLCDGAEVFKGFARLITIIKNQNKIIYEVNITSNLREYFTAMGDSYIGDLDLSALPITRDDSEILNIGGYTQGFDYPLINTGRHDFSTATPSLQADDMLPSIYAYTVMQAIDTLTGFNIVANSSFFTSTFFKSLVLPSLPAYGTIPNRQAIVTMSIDLQNNHLGTISIKIRCRRTPHTTGTQVDIYDSGWISALVGVHNISRIFTINVDANDVIDFSVESLWAIVAYKINSTSTITIVYQNNGVTGADGDLSLSNSVSAVYSVAVENTIRLNTIDSGAGTWDTGSYFHNTPTIYLQNYLCDNIKCKDFVISILRMFNIYMWADKIEPLKLYSECRDVNANSTGYYTTSLIDWSSKLDISKDFKILPMGLLDAKQYLFKYKDDADWFNKYYQEQFGYNYGRHLEIIDNDFMVNTNSNELIFSPAPLRQSSANNFIIPTIVTANPTLASTNQSLNTFKGNVRIFFCNQTMLYAGDPAYNWDMVSAAGTTTTAGYIYAGHFDEPITPTLELNFDKPNIVFYDFDASLYPSDTLFYTYHSKMINEITDKDSKIIQCYIHLTPHDMQKVDFRYRYQIGNQLYRLNKITDFNPNGTGSTLVELIRINPKDATVPTPGRIDFSDIFN